MRVLFSSFNQKFGKSLGTFDFGDFIILFVAEYRFAFFIAVMKFLK